MSDIVYAQGSTPSHSWAFRGPRSLVDPGAVQSAWERRLRTGLQGLARDLKRDAQAVYSDVPPIRDGFSYDTQSSPFPRVRLRNQSALFAVVEYRTRPHTITARHGDWLRFPFPDGHWVQVRSVNHPGTKGRYAIDPIFARYDPQFGALLDAAALDAINA